MSTKATNITFPESFSAVQKRRITNQIKIGKHHGFEIVLSSDNTKLIWKDQKTEEVVYTESVENYKP